MKSSGETHGGPSLTVPGGYSNICLVTATTDRFVPGTLVTLSSFLTHHPRFDGDIVVIHDNLSAANRAVLTAAIDGVRFEPISPRLRAKLAGLCAARPDFAPRLAQFYSLEAFRLHGYRKVLVYDSDVLVQAPVDDLFDRGEDLLGCGDVMVLCGWRRDAASFAPLPPGMPAGAAGVFERTFSTGFLLIDARLTGEHCYADLVALVAPETWDGTHTWHTDQLILNRYFAGRQTLVGWTYNFLLPCAAAIQAKEGVDARSAKMLHFNGNIKPWMPDAMLDWTQGDPERPPMPAFKLWYDAYVDILASVYLRRGLTPRAGRDAG